MDCVHKKKEEVGNGNDEQCYSVIPSTGLSVEVKICFEIESLGKFVSAARCILLCLVKSNVIYNI